MITTPEINTKEKKSSAPIHSPEAFYTHLRQYGLESLLQNGALHPDITTESLSHIQNTWREETKRLDRPRAEHLTSYSGELSAFIIRHASDHELIKQSETDLLELAKLKKRVGSPMQIAGLEPQVTPIKQAASSAQGIILWGDANKPHTLISGGNVLKQLMATAKGSDKKAIKKILEQTKKATHVEAKLAVVEDVLRGR